MPTDLLAPFGSSEATAESQVLLLGSSRPLLDVAFDSSIETMDGIDGKVVVIATWSNRGWSFSEVTFNRGWRLS